MSVNDNKDFEFIKEQVIVRKHKKVKKFLLPILITFCLAVLFGLIAAVTFVIAEPRLYNFLHKNEDTKTPVSFPTKYPDETAKVPTLAPTPKPIEVVKEPEGNSEPDTVIVEKTIDADKEDFISMYDELRTVAYEANKSIVKLTSIVKGKDWFGNPIEIAVNTTGLIVANNKADLLILVSLDRVKDSSSIKINFSDTVAVDAAIQDYDSEINIAVIAVSLEDIPSSYMSSLKVATLGEYYPVTVGSPVIAIGNPNGHPESIEIGIVTSRGSWATITDNKLDLFNTNIDDNDNSDGVIVNIKGEVIGIITRTLKTDINLELSTAIGISKMKPIIERMGNGEPQIYFGVKTEDMSDAVKQDRSITNGIYVTEVQPDSPAFAAGMKNGDLILQIDDQSITNTNNFNNTITNYKPNDKVLVKIIRTSGSTDKEIDLEMELKKKPK
jgi:S1-C subfamily serine protease